MVKKDDDDLDDLLGAEMAPLNLDHLTRSPVKMSPRSTKNASRRSIWEGLSNYVSMLCYFYPIACGLVIFALIGLFFLAVGTLLFNPVDRYGVIAHDHSNIRSKFDLAVGQIDHWCLSGDDDHCTCNDPLVPLSRGDHKSWVQAFKANRKIVKTFQGDPTRMAKLDVAFVGESVIEEMDGRWMGLQRGSNLKNLETIFNSHFSRKGGGRVDGVALGIAGDTAPNVLWRLLHGEMEPYFNPRVWWVSLGMNDLARMQCSEEVVVLGVLRVVEEILENKPDAQIVINSLFPMAEVRGKAYPLISDYQDSFEDPKGRKRIRGNQRQLKRRRRKRDEDDEPQIPRGPKTEQEEMQESEAIEKNRDRKYRKKRKKRGKKNPVLQEKTRERRYTPGTAHMRKKSPPLWTSIRAINRELRKFAEKHERVTFFDATNVFATREGKKKYTLQSNMISSRGHPTEAGFIAWEDEVLQRLEQILADMKNNKPHLFPNQPSSSSNSDGDDNYDISQEYLDFDFDNLGDDDDVPDDYFKNDDDNFVIEQEDGRGAPRSSRPVDDDAGGSGDDDSI